MQINHQNPVLLPIPVTQQKTAQDNTPSTSENAGTSADSQNVDRDYINGKTGNQYPEESPEERHDRHTRGLFKFKISGGGGFKRTGGGGGGGGGGGKKILGGGGGADFGVGGIGNIKKISRTPKPHKPAGGSNSPSNIANTQQGINDLSRGGAFKFADPGVGVQIRNSLISAGLEGLVNSGLSVGQQALSGSWGTKIENQANMPGAEKKNPDGTITTVDPAATAQQKFDAQLVAAELNTITLCNSIIAVNEGVDASAVDMSPNAPTDTKARLDNLEKILDSAESPLEGIAKNNGVLYTRPPAVDTSTWTPEARLEHIKDRVAKMGKMFKVLVAMKNAEEAE